MALSPPRQQRIPAWKRIGLKLTHAKDEADHVPSLHRTHQPSEASPTATLIRQAASVEDIRPQKRRKTSAEPRIDLQSSAKVDGHRIDSPDPQPGASNAEITTTADVLAPPTLQRRKLVTFTPETKQEDAINKPVFRQRRAISDQTAQQADQQPTSSERIPTKSKPKKSPADSPSGGRSKQKATQETPAFVKYLVHFHTDKSSWKFNKKKQNDLFKNLYNLDRLPAEYNEAILSYVRGLEGANAIARIQESSQAVLDEIIEKEEFVEGAAKEVSGSKDTMTMEYGEARQDAYSRALQQSLERFERAGAQRNEYDDQQYNEMRQEAERARRAHSVLSEYLGNNNAPKAQIQVNARMTHRDSPLQKPHSSSIATDDTATEEQTHTSARRKRKARTQDPNVIEIESDSSSSSSSSSESNTQPPKKKTILPTTTIPKINHQRMASPPKTAKMPALPSGSININHKNASKKIFDDDLLDEIFPKPKSYHETAPKRKAGAASSKKPRGFAYTHGTRADESGSEDD